MNISMKQAKVVKPGSKKVTTRNPYAGRRVAMQNAQQTMKSTGGMGSGRRKK